MCTNIFRFICNFDWVKEQVFPITIKLIRLSLLTSSHFMQALCKLNTFNFESVTTIHWSCGATFHKLNVIIGPFYLLSFRNWNESKYSIDWDYSQVACFKRGIHLHSHSAAIVRLNSMIYLFNCPAWALWTRYFARILTISIGILSIHLYAKYIGRSHFCANSSRRKFNV